MQLVLFGASGNIGRRIAAEALARGHHVTGVVRDPARLTDLDPWLTIMRGDVTDPAQVAHLARGADAIVSAVGNSRTPSGPAPAPLFAQAARALLAGASSRGPKR